MEYMSQSVGQALARSLGGKGGAAADDEDDEEGGMMGLSDEQLKEIMGDGPRWSDEERKAFCDEITPLFMDHNPTKEEMESNPHLKALSNIEYDDIDTPETLATQAKENGNSAFSKGPAFYGNAIKFFNEAIDHASKSKDKKRKREMKELRSVCYANLAAVYMGRKKFITALDCCEDALKLNGRNVKAAYRAAKCCLSLGRALAACDFAELGLEQEPESAVLLALKKEAEQVVAVQKRNAAKAAEELEKRRMAIEAVREACKERRVQVGPPLYSRMRRTAALPYVEKYVDPESGESSNLLHWPLLLLYPQYHMSDFLEDVGEVTFISDLLRTVLPSSVAQEEREESADRPLWDKKGDYTAETVDVFYRSNACKPIKLSEAWQEALLPAGSTLADGASAGSLKEWDTEPEETWLSSSWVRIPPAAPLILVLSQPDCIVADIPVLYIVSRSSPVYAEMRRRSGGVFKELAVPDFDTVVAGAGRK